MHKMRNQKFLTELENIKKNQTKVKNKITEMKKYTRKIQQQNK